MSEASPAEIEEALKAFEEVRIGRREYYWNGTGLDDSDHEPTAILVTPENVAEHEQIFIARWCGSQAVSGSSSVV